MMKRIHIFFFLLAASITSSAQLSTNLLKDSVYIDFDFDGPDFKFFGNYNFTDNGIKPEKYSFGVYPRARIEGKSLIDTKPIGIVQSNFGNCMQYTLGAQDDHDKKARAEHYLFVGELNKCYVSEFSLQLHPKFTIVDKVRPDGGPAWCVLKQWHQSSPESPPMSLEVVTGTSNVIRFGILYGDYKINTRSAKSKEMKVKLGHWYNFRVEWKVSPNDELGYCRVYVSDVRKGKEFLKKDLWFNYNGPIGYTLKGKPEVEMTDLCHNIREHQGIYQNSHLSPETFHAVLFDNVQIYLSKSTINQ